MAFSRPTLRELIKQTTTDAEREAGAIQLRQSNLRVLPKVFAFAVHGVYAYLDWTQRQLFADTAEVEYLERQASIQGIYRKAATTAEGELTVTMTEGARIPVGTEFIAPDLETRYATTAEPETGSSVVTVRCTTAGAAGNAEAGLVYTLASPVTGVQAEATGGEMSGGADRESDDDLRSRLLYRLQNPPRGGTASDYVAWAQEVPGVTRAWCFPKELGLGTVVVRFMTDGLTEDGIPTGAMVEKVQSTIELEAPVTAAVTVLAPTALPVDVEIADLMPDTPAIRAQIEAELRSLLYRECVPGKVFYVSHLRQAISDATGEEDHKVISPTEDIICPADKVLTLGTVTYD